MFIVDSHSTCQHKPTIKLFNYNNILVDVIPAHTSTIIQPLDLAPNGEFKRYLQKYFKPNPEEDKPTKCNRLLTTSVFCLQAALTALPITQGFSRAGIWPYNKETPLHSNLIRDPLNEIPPPPPRSGRKRVNIAGKVLTFEQPSLALPPPPTHTPTAPITPILLKPPPQPSIETVP